MSNYGNLNINRNKNRKKERREAVGIRKSDGFVPFLVKIYQE